MKPAVCRSAIIAVSVLVLGPGSAEAASPVGAGITLSPQPGTRDASPSSEISFLGAGARALGQLTVVGSRSGVHAGTLVPYASATGASFVAAKPFAPGERVSVRAAGARLDFQFTIAHPARLSPGAATSVAAATVGAYSFISNPSLHPASVRVTVNNPSTAPGDLFVAPLTDSARPGRMLGQRGPLILDGQGNPIWEHPMHHGLTAMDFRVQTFHGAPVLTWWQGTISPQGYGAGVDVIVNSSYRRIATVRAGNGARADLHELVITPAGAALLTAYRAVHANLSSLGGPRNGTLLDSEVQQVDIRTGRVMFQWSPFGHIGLRQSYARPYRNMPFDAFHVNSIDRDGRGNLLLSARNTSAVYDISRRSGRIRWRLGGTRSSFKLEPGVRFAYQHDAHFQAGGTISLFDDGASPPVEKQSRGLIIRLDWRHRAAHLAKQYTHPRPLLAGSQGNEQVLPNGDVFEGWGSQPYLSEFSAAGQLLFDAHFHGPDGSYRSFRFPWIGHPRRGPAVASRKGHAGNTIVYASWNGATEVASWRVLSGSRSKSLAQVASGPRSGFETALAVAGRARYYAVQALDAAGHVLGTSRASRSR